MSLNRELRETCDAWIQSCERATATLANAGLGSGLRSDLDAALADPKVRVVVCGEWNAGKSTLVNALVGVEGLLPVNVNPCSSYLTVVEPGPAVAHFRSRGGREESITRAEFHALTAQSEHDPLIDRLRAEAPLTWPGDEAVIVDTPGLEDISRQRSDVTLSYLPKADAIVVVTRASQGVTASVLAFVRDHLTRREQSRVVFVLNQKDHLDGADELAKQLAACREAVSGLMPRAPWLTTDARGAGKDQSAAKLASSGVGQLRSELDGLVRRERTGILVDRFVGPARSRLGDVVGRLAAEEAGLRLTVAEAEKRVVEYKAKVREATANNNEAFTNARQEIRAELQRWLSGVPTKVNRLAMEVREELANLDDLEALRQFVNSDALGRRLARDLRELSDEIATQLSRAIEKAARSALQDKLIGPVTVDLSSDMPLPPIDTLFRHVPSWVVTTIEILLLDIATPGGGIGGVLVGVLERFGLGKLLQHVKGFSFLKVLMPTEMCKRQLQTAVGTSLDAYSQQIVPHIEAQTNQAADDALQNIRDALERRIGAVEAGLEDARVTLSSTQAQVDSRKAELKGIGNALLRAEHELDRLAEAFRSERAGPYASTNKPQSQPARSEYA